MIRTIEAHVTSMRSCLRTAALRDWKHSSQPGRMGSVTKQFWGVVIGVGAECRRSRVEMSRPGLKHHKRSRPNRRQEPPPFHDPRSTEPIGRHSDSTHSEQQRRNPPDRKHKLYGELETEKLERVQKVLAHAGLGSRRSCEDLIKQGRVSDRRTGRPRARHPSRPGTKHGFASTVN